jgi:D-hydroxyproline dehydrogenase subunit alpha
MNKVVELVVVGAGPAGIEAAITASTAGVEVILVDSSPRPGGQYFHQIPESFQATDASRHEIRAQQYIRRLSSSNVRVFNNTLVWGIFEGAVPGTWCLTLHGPEAPARLNTRAVILATGAYDRSIAFPGWDLPGVITAGAASRMIKNQHLLPGKRVLVSGTGPLQVQAAALLSRGGAEVVSVCESSVDLFWRGLAHLGAVWGQGGRLKEGFDYMKTLRGAHVPYRLGWSITAARGEDRVREVTFAKLDKNSKPIPQSQIVQPVDAVVVGYGLTPGTELCRQLNCDFEFVAQRGGYVPARDNELQTSCAGIYAVGDCAGLGGAEMSMIEGRIAGSAVAARLAHLTEAAAGALIQREKRDLRREQRFERMLGDLFSPAAGLYGQADPETVICRCEQVTLGQIRDAISFGAQTVSDVKNIVRTGMGNCQGRTCGSIVAQIMAAETGKPLAALRYFSIRPPIHPLPLSVIEEYGEGSTPADRGYAAE